MIKSLLLKAYLFIKRKIRDWGYWCETRSFMLNQEETLQVSTLPKGKYLILIPHSDDEWIGNSTLISDPQYDVALFDMDMPGGDTEEIHGVRYVEMQSIAQKYNRTLYSKKNNDSINDVINTLHPDFVNVPYFFDWHPEHRMVLEELCSLTGSNEKFKVVMYQVTVPILNYNITHANPLDKTNWRNKWEQFRKVYLTQSLFPAYRVACQERINGKIIEAFSGEVFSLMNYPEWCSYISKNLPDMKQMVEIKHKIVSITGIREYRQPSI